MLPSRVIDVGLDGQEPSLHISEPFESTSYVALSYCWGGPQTASPAGSSSAMSSGLSLRRGRSRRPTAAVAGWSSPSAKASKALSTQSPCRHVETAARGACRGDTGGDRVGVVGEARGEARSRIWNLARLEPRGQAAGGRAVGRRVEEGRIER
jgi:hypothetical protein